MRTSSLFSNFDAGVCMLLLRKNLRFDFIPHSTGLLGVAPCHSGIVPKLVLLQSNTNQYCEAFWINRSMLFPQGTYRGQVAYFS
jgi:hypothetical protein